MANKRSISTMRPTPSEKQRGPQSLPLRMENFGGAGKPESSKHFSAEIAAFASLWSVILGKRGLVFNSLTFSCYLASILCKNAEMPHFRAAFLLCIFFINTFWSEWGDSNSRHLAPKCRALPVELHPDIHFSAMIPRRGVKIKIFLSVVIPVVKATFVPFSATGGKPAIARVARLCGVSPCPVPDTATALPNQARYQLRYTRIFTFLS